jgi:hypothetical protein
MPAELQLPYRCPLGHPIKTIQAVECPNPECDALTVYEPVAHGMAMERQLAEIRLYAEKLRRGFDRAMKMVGADIIDIIDGDA